MQVTGVVFVCPLYPDTHDQSANTGQTQTVYTVYYAVHIPSYTNVASLLSIVLKIRGVKSGSTLVFCDIFYHPYSHHTLIDRERSLVFGNEICITINLM